MELLYDRLYNSDNLRDMPISDYLPTLVDEIISTFPNSSTVQVIKKIDDFMISVNTLPSLGIIVNELLSNAMKYAFAGMKSGQIKVSASTRSPGAAIVIEDSGRGIPDSVDMESGTGFGLKLVAILTKQINGTISLERGKGTRFVLEFEL